MKTLEIMTQPVITVTPETSIAAAARLMLQHRISGLPVVDETGAAVGIITEGDLLRRAETGTQTRHTRWLELILGPGRLADEYAHAHARTVGEAMIGDVVSVASTTDVADVVQLMHDRGIKRLPVVDNGRLVGIVSRANLVHALVTALAQRPVRAASDEEIREAILHAIGLERWAPRFSVDVAVKDGIVDLSGAVTDDRERTALLVLAENVPGVKSVRDNIVWVEPTTGIVVPH